MGISVYDQRMLKKKSGRPFKNQDKFMNFNPESEDNTFDDKDKYKDLQAKDISEPCVWRDKLNIHHDMDIVQMME